MLSSELAALYQATPDAWPRCSDLVRAYVSEVRRSFERLPWPVAFSDVDPYRSSEEQRDRVRSDGYLIVYTGGSDGLPWSAVDNWRMRAVHDSLDHLGPDGAGSFGLQGELEAFRRAAVRMGDGYAPLLLSEIVLQAAYYSDRGVFASQKLVLVDDPLRCLRQCGA